MSDNDLGLRAYLEELEAQQAGLGGDALLGRAGPPEGVAPVPKGDAGILHDRPGPDRVLPKGGVVLDPFMGSGSTGIAALAEGLRFIGVDSEVEYVAIARERIGPALCEVVSAEP